MILKRVGVMSCAKISGTLYALIGVLIGCVLAFVSTLGFALGQAASSDAPKWFGALFGVGAIVLVPIIYGVMGFVGGLIVALLYNMLAGFVGGIQLELQ